MSGGSTAPSSACPDAGSGQSSSLILLPFPSNQHSSFSPFLAQGLKVELVPPWIQRWITGPGLKSVSASCAPAMWQVQDVHVTQPEPMRSNKTAQQGWTKTLTLSFAGRKVEGGKPRNFWQPSCNYKARACLRMGSTHRKWRQDGERETRSWWHHLSPWADSRFISGLASHGSQ